jgi:magnesium-transporting ATPase (P-type)
LETVSEKLISLPCTFTLGLEHPLFLVLQVVKEARKFMANIQNGLVFSSVSFIGFSAASLILLIFGLPPFITLLQCIFIGFCLIPVLALSFLPTPSEEGSMKRLPIKIDILEVVSKDSYFYNILLRTVIFAAILVEMHVWALAVAQSDYAFYNWHEENSIHNMIQLCNFWLSVLLTCVYSSGWVNGCQSWFHIKKVNNWWWLSISVLQIIVASIIFVVYLAAYQGFTEMRLFLKEAWYVYFTIFFECIILFFILEALNIGIWSLAKNLQMTLDVYFQTKLGVYSPR